ncbi:MAG: hypothetical protein AAF417_12350 [Pseudomonadota bacterium]
MSEWLELMLEEIDRKQEERRAALDESARRRAADSATGDSVPHDASNGASRRQTER